MRETHWVRQNPLHFWQRSNYCTIRVPTKITSQTSDIFSRRKHLADLNNYKFFLPLTGLGSTPSSESAC